MNEFVGFIKLSQPHTNIRKRKIHSLTNLTEHVANLGNNGLKKARGKEKKFQRTLRHCQGFFFTFPVENLLFVS